MQVTEVRIKRAETTNPSEERLLGFASITFDGGFAVQDIKIISGPNGIFVAMPSRKVAAHCPACKTKNALGSNFCNQCGGKLPPIEAIGEERPKLYADVAHPINTETREMIEAEIIKAYHAQVGGAPGTVRPVTAARSTRRYFSSST
jgi:stage V sporulation protein G